MDLVKASINVFVILMTNTVASSEEDYDYDDDVTQTPAGSDTTTNEQGLKNFWNTEERMAEVENLDNLVPPSYHKDGPMPIISDSLYSLIILLYVSIIFVFMFFSFCWKTPQRPEILDKHSSQDIPMITTILDEMEKQQIEKEKEKLAAEDKEGESESHDQSSPLMSPEKLHFKAQMTPATIHEEDEVTQSSSTTSDKKGTSV